MEAIVRTVYGAYVQTCLLTGTPQQFHQNTTLNEKFGILASTLPTSAERSKLAYYTVGNRGHRNVTGAEGRQKSEPVQHLPTDAALYGHMPLVMRRLTEDLTQAERARYALRKEESHNGEMYAKYYLRRLDMSGVIPSMEYKTVQDGVETTTPFVPNSSNLNPTPPTVANTGTNLVDGDYVQASARLVLTISEQEAAELLNVAKILWDDEGYAIISELALCTGVDKVVPITTGLGSTFNMNEAIGVQIAAFVPGQYPMVFNNTGLEITLDVGASEPLFNLL